MRFRKMISRFLTIILVVTLSLILIPEYAVASDCAMACSDADLKAGDWNDDDWDYFESSYTEYTNEETGYRAVVNDDANYLKNSERDKLLEKMKPITKYCNVIYLTDNHNYSYSEDYSENLCRQTLGKEFGYNSNSVIYLVDNEYDYIFATGDAYDVIDTDKAYIITDNVYRYSEKEQYYNGAAEAFEEIYDVLEGRRIAQPMRYITNGLMALFIAFLVNFIIVDSKSRLKRASNAEMIEGSVRLLQKTMPDVRHVNTTRTYSPRSSSSGGGHGGGGHGGGGHGGGGGHSH